MGSLADRLNAMSPERRLYTLQTLPQHLFDAGPSHCARLRQLVTERDWFEAQRALIAWVWMVAVLALPGLLKFLPRRHEARPTG